VGCTESAVIMDIPAPFRRLIAWFGRQSPVTTDLVVIGLVGLPIYVLALWYGALDRFFELTRRHTHHELDWLIILVVCVGIAAIFFSIRRLV